MSLKILGGEFGGRLLKAPKGDQTRPTTSMLRKAVFDILQPKIHGAIFLDLFSGSGAMGIEAVSRGAAKAIFVDSHREAIRALKDNITLLKIEDRTEVMQSDVFKALLLLQKRGAVCDLIYADPPYDKSQLYRDLLVFFDASPLLAPHGTLFIESPAPSPYKKEAYSLRRLRELPTRSYGATELYQYIN